MSSMQNYVPIEPIPLELLKEPLVWLFAEHYRHRDVCLRLLSLVDVPVFEEVAYRDIYNFIHRDMPLHIIDEEDDLFPLMRRRCSPDDGIEKILGMLSADHADDMKDVGVVESLLSTALAERKSLCECADTLETVSEFCHQQKRHIALENAVVLPIARHRLTPCDLMELGGRMAARRGLESPFGCAS